MLWQKVYKDDGSWSWTIYDTDEKVKAESAWQGKILLSSKIAGP